MNDLGVHVIIIALAMGPNSGAGVLSHLKTEPDSIPVTLPFRIPEDGHSPKTSNSRLNVLSTKPF
jgi:hypothetical protein